MKITRSSNNSSNLNPAERFTGPVHTDTMLAAEDHGTASGSHVTSEPGAGTAWHPYPAGKTLIVAFGLGRVQEGAGKFRSCDRATRSDSALAYAYRRGATPHAAKSHLVIRKASTARPSHEWIIRPTNSKAAQLYVQTGAGEGNTSTEASCVHSESIGLGRNCPCRPWQ